MFGLKYMIENMPELENIVIQLIKLVLENSYTIESSIMIHFLLYLKKHISYSEDDNIV